MKQIILVGFYRKLRTAFLPALLCILALASIQLLRQNAVGGGGITAAPNPAATHHHYHASRPVRKDEEWRLEKAKIVGGKRSGASPIPKILHYVFKDEMAYEQYKPLVSSCLEKNPDWMVYLWRDSDAMRLMKEHYQSFITKYQSYRDRLEKSDSVRYMILHRFGGIYLDMDVECLKPFDWLLQNQSSSQVEAFLGEERREQTRILYGYSFCTMNSLMGSRPGHPFFLSVVSWMKSMPSLSHARLTTGPDLLTRVYREWTNCTECQARNPVTVFSSRLVSPLMDTSLVNWEAKCAPFLKPRRSAAWQSLTQAERWGARGCAELVEKSWRFDDTDGDSTVAVHRFLHLGYGNPGGRQTFNILRQFPRVKIFYDG